MLPLILRPRVLRYVTRVAIYTILSGNRTVSLRNDDLSSLYNMLCFHKQLCLLTMICTLLQAECDGSTRRSALSDNSLSDTLDRCLAIRPSWGSDEGSCLPCLPRWGDHTPLVSSHQPFHDWPHLWEHGENPQQNLLIDSKDQDLQLENEAIQEVPDSEPDKQQYQQQIKTESETESEEDNNIQTSSISKLLINVSDFTYRVLRSKKRPSSLVGFDNSLAAREYKNDLHPTSATDIFT